MLRQIVEGRRFLDNCYPQVVQPGGNAVAQQQLLRAMDIVDARWRGIGVIPRSGYRIRPEFAAHDARLHFSIAEDSSRRRAGQMPPGCDCAKVVLGKIYPDQCRLYGRACTPRAPVGPCMVSDEGACRIWWASRAREPALATDGE
jgi:hydrogenase expression/formation protein HypD